MRHSLPRFAGRGQGHRGTTRAWAGGAGEAPIGIRLRRASTVPGIFLKSPALESKSTAAVGAFVSGAGDLAPPTAPRLPGTLSAALA